LAAGRKRSGRQPQKRRLIFFEQRFLGAFLPPQPALPILHALLPQDRVQFREVAHLRHGHKKVQPGKLHQTLHHALLITPRRPTEVVPEQVVALELAEAPRQAPAPAATDDLRHRHLRVVIADPPRHTPEEREGLYMPLPERLRAFPLKGHHERGIAVGQRQHEKRHLPQNPVHLHQRLAKVHLRFPGRVDQRHKYFLLPLRLLPHHVFDDRVTARESLGLQPLPQPLGRVPLLARQRLVLLQDLFDPLLKGPQLLARPGLLLLVTRRLGMFQHLLQRPPVHPRLPENLAPAHSFHQHSSADLGPLFHSGIHSSPCLKVPPLASPRPVSHLTPAALFDRRLHV
jgi:hypothetical protein